MSGPIWSTSCLDWERRIVAGESLIPFQPLFPAEAEAALEIFRGLRVVDVAGSPTIGECCRPWLMDFAAAIFGSYDADEGRRLIRDYMLLVSKKNSKSTTAAGIMLTALLRNWRKSGEFLIVAPTMEIAKNAFEPAADMVAADEELSSLLHVKPNIRTIEHRLTKARLKVIAADNETVSGKKAIGVLIDELWLFGNRANAENMLREVTGGITARPEGFTIYLSTQSDTPPAGVFKKKLRQFRDIRDGKLVDNKSLGVLYEFPPEMVKSRAYMRPENFYITNPNLGASVDATFITDKLAEAERDGEDSLCGFVAKHLNVEIGISLGSDNWEGAEFWPLQADETLTLEALIARSDVVVVGIDGGGLDDLLGLAVMGRDSETRDWLLWTHAWAHTKVFERRQSIASVLRDFEREGRLTVYDQPGDDVSELVDYIMQAERAGKLPAKHAIGVDVVGISEIVDALEQAGISQEGERVVGVTQGWKLANTIKTTARRLAAGGMWHDGSGLMTWCVGNAKVEPRGNAILITKQTAGAAKIDPLMATFNAVALMAKNPDALGASFWEGKAKGAGQPRGIAWPS